MSATMPKRVRLAASLLDAMEAHGVTIAETIEILRLMDEPEGMSAPPIKAPTKPAPKPAPRQSVVLAWLSAQEGQRAHYSGAVDALGVTRGMVTGALAALVRHGTVASLGGGIYEVRQSRGKRESK